MGGGGACSSAESSSHLKGIGGYVSFLEILETRTSKMRFPANYISNSSALLVTLQHLVTQQPTDEHRKNLYLQRKGEVPESTRTNESNEIFRSKLNK